MYEMLLDGRADAALTAKRTVNAALSVLPLFEEYATFFVPPGHRLYEKEILELGDLDGEKIVSAESDRAEMEWIRRRYLDRGVRIEPVHVEDRNATLFHPELIVASSSIAEQFWPPTRGCRSLRIRQKINAVTHYAYYFVFAPENRTMGELYLQMKTVL